VADRRAAKIVEIVADRRCVEIVEIVADRRRAATAGRNRSCPVTHA
jgi:hypothetical protein